MTPQERQLVDDLFDRLAKLESAPRDPDAAAAIAQGLRIAPNAVYALVQTVLVQDEALKRANSRIQELESRSAPEPKSIRRLSRFDAGDDLRARSVARLGAERARRPKSAAARSGTAARCCSRPPVDQGTIMGNPMTASRRSTGGSLWWRHDGREAR